MSDERHHPTCGAHEMGVRRQSVRVCATADKVKGKTVKGERKEHKQGQDLERNGGAVVQT